MSDVDNVAPVKQKLTPPRTYRTILSVADAEVVDLLVRSPRITALELDKIRSRPEVLQAMNDRHLADVGSVRVTRPCRVGGVYLDPGSYQLGVSVAEEGSLQVQLGKEGATSTVSLTPVAAATEVTAVSIALLPEEEIDRFDLEVRLGNLAGRVSVDFNMKRLIVGLNNAAHDLLTSSTDARVNAADAELALRLSGKANAMTSGENPFILDTYALALFHNGNMDRAIEIQKSAIERAEENGHRVEMVARLKAFELANRR